MKEAAGSDGLAGRGWRPEGSGGWGGLTWEHEKAESG